MRTTVLLVAATALGLADAANRMLTPYGALNKRQAFDPEETTGSGANCVEAFGEGYVECVPATDSEPRLCINPDLGEKCCNSLWGCPADSFCLVQDLCCPDGLDPETCAAQNDVTLPSDFSIPGTTPATTTPKASGSAIGSGSAIPTKASATGTYGWGSGGNATTTRGGGKPPIVTAGAAYERAGGSAVVGAVVFGVAALLL